MKNRDVLHNMCLYDLLVMMDENSDGDTCIVELLGGKTWSDDYLGHRCYEHKCCQDCIAAWLDEEVNKA
jgi:hypothetical protein